MKKCPDCGRVVDTLSWRYEDKFGRCRVCLDIRTCKDSILAIQRVLRRHQKKLKDAMKLEATKGE